MKLRAIFIVKKEKTMKELPKTYEPRDVEDRLYKFWVDNGYFHAERDPDKKPFTIVMPPPNVTGQLHMGHAMDAAMQDVLIRFKRMQGYSALWIPGVDHAGIATQIRVEEELRKEGKTRYDLGREKFLERVWAWKHQYGDRIVEQQKRLGASCDWDRARFTMDEGCSKAVREVFVNLYEQGLIYKGSRIINWPFRHGPVRCRGRICRQARPSVACALSAGRRLRRGHHRDDPARDHARRLRCVRQSK